MTITTAEAISLLEGTLFESATLAAANAPSLVAQSTEADTVASEATTLAQSTEAGIAEQVIRYYQAALGRTPGATEIHYYVAIAEQGMTAAEIAQGAAAVPQAQWNIISSDFVNSPEFQTDFSAGGSAGLVALFYKNILDRTASTTEIAYYQTQLSTGFTNATLMQEFSNSPEYQTDSASAITAQLAGNGVTEAGGSPVSTLLTLTADPTKTITATGTGNELIVDYANPTASAYTHYVSGFQTLGLGSASSGSFDLASLVGSTGAIDVTANLAGGNVTVTNSSASQTLSIDTSITSENQLTLQMSTQAAASTNPSLTITLTPGVTASISHLTDTVTLGGTFTAGDVITWTVDSQTLSYTVAQGDTASTVATKMASQMLGKLDNPEPVYAISASGGALSVSGGFWQNSMIDQISATGGETATVAHTVTTTSINAPGYTTLTINTGDTPDITDLLQVTDSALTHLVLSGSTEILLSAPTGQISSIDASHYTAADLGLEATYAASGVTFIGGDAGFQFFDTNLASGATATFTAGNGNNSVEIGSSYGTTNVSNAVVTVGNGNNYINLGNCTGTTTVTAGSGENSIILSIGANTVTLGAHTGADTVEQLNLSSLFSGASTTITGLQHGDTLQLLLSAGTESWANGSAAAAQVTAAATLAATITAATAVTNGVNGVFSWFQFSGNTYVLETVGTATSTSNSGYSMVELTGLHDLSASSISNHAIVL